MTGWRSCDTNFKQDEYRWNPVGTVYNYTMSKKKIYSDCDYIKNYWNPIGIVIYLHELHYTLVYFSTPSGGDNE